MKRVTLTFIFSIVATLVLRAGIVYRLDAPSATLKGSATLVSMGQYDVVDIGGSSGYIDLGTQIGEDFAVLSDFSISCYYLVRESQSLSGNGRFLWTFSTSSACGSTSGLYHAYRLNVQRVATSTGGYSNETGYEVGTASAKGRWVHVCYTQSGLKGTLYIDGEKQGTVSGIERPSSLFTTAPTYNWIARSAFTDDHYLHNTLIYGFTLYDEELSADEVSELYKETEQLEYAYRYGTAGDFTALSQAVDDADALLASISAGEYPQMAIDDYRDVVEYCRAMVRQALVSQTLIDEALDKLSDAESVLLSSAGFTFDATQTPVYNTERGFRHPGGFHTEEDFARVRQQLADGNEKVTNAYEVLCSAEYAQSTVTTWPVETIVRGGGSGENYINAARGATMAYQNALRWHIGGDEKFAKHAVEILMEWANTTKAIGGDSNYALAAGIYGYEFAQAAELVRDYEGWSREDFETFKQWMLNLWYTSAIGFLRVRNGTWENSSQWWRCPGHYWSNWGLCCAMCVASIGVLCDDVYIYNQGMSFFKYDQVGTFVDPRTADPILNDGLNEFLGNLVVTTYPYDRETGAYGKVGQMQESGRDIGHATMALGLAVDMAHMGYNQGDDLFSYMDHRLAAGVEYVAGQVRSFSDLPWVNYHYATNGYYYTDSRSTLMTGPALGSQIRPYWGTIIGHYEGVKGVEMPISKPVYNSMGIDAGGTGGTSGSYDHLGYSVLMNTRDGMADPDSVPTLLTPYVSYAGETLQQSDLGGLYNPYWDNGTTAIDASYDIDLWAELPEGEEDTGKWRWNTGETTKTITVPSNRSYAYRVTYTNQKGVESERVFTIAAKGDCEELNVSYYYTYDGATIYDTDLTVLFGSSVTFGLSGGGGWNHYEWGNGETSQTLTLAAITSDRQVQGALINHGGRRTVVTFNVKVTALTPTILVNGSRHKGVASIVVDEGDEVTLDAGAAELLSGGTYLWSDGSTDSQVALGEVMESCTYTVLYTFDGTEYSQTFEVLVTPKTQRLLELGNYTISLRDKGTYLTNDGLGSTPSFQPYTGDEATQVWYLYRSSSKNPQYELRSLADSSTLSSSGEMVSRLASRPHHIEFAAGTDYACIYISTSVLGTHYWEVADDGTISYDGKDEFYGYPFEVTLVETTGITTLKTDEEDDEPTVYYDLSGSRVARPSRGIYIAKGKKILVK